MTTSTPRCFERVRLLQHPVGLADAGGEPDVQLQPAALGALDQLEEVLRATAQALGLPGTFM